MGVFSGLFPNFSSIVIRMFWISSFKFNDISVVRRIVLICFVQRTFVAWQTISKSFREITLAVTRIDKHWTFNANLSFDWNCAHFVFIFLERCENKIKFNWYADILLFSNDYYWNVCVVPSSVIHENSRMY